MLLVVLIPSQDRAPDQPDKKADQPEVRIRETKTDVVLSWNEIALQAIRQAKTPPPLAARHLAILHAALADTVNTIYQTHKSYRVGLRAVEPIHPEVAAAACGQRVLAELYPRQARTFDRELQKTLAAVPVSRQRTLALGLGRHVADRILEWRREDGHDRPALYLANPDTGVWRPTPPDRAAALLPRYGQQPLFGVKDRKRIRYNPPPELEGKEYSIDLFEVKRLGGRRSLLRTAEESIIAWFWNDGPGTCTPPGHWNQIAREIAEAREQTLPENARTFALLNIALADAAILCWDCKYRYRLWRPITAIRETDPDWTSLLDTPPFPSYTSGHSTFSGAAATILTRVFGEEGVEFTIGSDGFPGTERSYKNFWEAAREAGKSRIYGGIHFECDNREGLALGKRIADEILATQLLPPDDPTRPRQPRLEEGATPRPLPRGPDNTAASSRRERP
jgi:hypothetical protein